MFKYNKFLNKTQFVKWVNSQSDHIRVNPDSNGNCIVARWATNCGLLDADCGFDKIYGMSNKTKKDEKYLVPDHLIMLQRDLFYLTIPGNYIRGRKIKSIVNHPDFGKKKFYAC